MSWNFGDQAASNAAQYPNQQPTPHIPERTKISNTSRREVRYIAMRQFVLVSDKKTKCNSVTLQQFLTRAKVPVKESLAINNETGTNLVALVRDKRRIYLCTNARL
jgi:hypothetical protein